MCASGATSFSVTAAGTAPFTYAWRHNSTPIPVGSNASAGTATLSLTGVALGDAGTYDCIVTNSCGSTTSSAGAVTVLVDLNGDNAINTLDLGIVLAHFGSSVAPGTLGDGNGDGVVNTVDLGLILNGFGHTCP